MVDSPLSQIPNLFLIFSVCPSVAGQSSQTEEPTEQLFARQLSLSRGPTVPLPAGGWVPPQWYGPQVVLGPQQMSSSTEFETETSNTLFWFLFHILLVYFCFLRVIFFLTDFYQFFLKGFFFFFFLNLSLEQSL